MTTALYRRYRPDSFADVIGQEHVTDPLRAALQEVSAATRAGLVRQVSNLVRAAPERIERNAAALEADPA